MNWLAVNEESGADLRNEMNHQGVISSFAWHGRKVLVLSLLALIFATPAHAARISDVTDTNVWEQALRFFSFRDDGLKVALAGCMLLGLNCGLLGGFIVVRRLSLVGDTLSHAVLPGVALGFLWSMSKDPVAILIGATLVGGLAMLVVNVITRTTKLKQDTALGLVLSSFFAIGLCLQAFIQRLPTGAKSGFDKFFFGQAAAISEADLWLLSGTTLVTLLFLTLCYRGLLTLSFHRGYGETLGLPMSWLHHALMLFTSFAVVTAMQAVGVVLVSAMLIIPAATAYLLTDRMHRLLIYAAVFGVLTAALGAFFSFLGNNLPTGPFMVLAGAVFFLVAFLFSPRHGWLVRLWRQRSRRLRTERENTLKAMHRVLENRGFHGESVSLLELAQLRRETLEESRHRALELQRAQLATMSESGNDVHFTPEGWQQAQAIVRNHRLWELYLTNIMQFESDHVHDEAEKIEHILGADAVRELERKLAFPQTDPHGRKIPGVRDAEVPPQPRADLTGYKSS